MQIYFSSVPDLPNWLYAKLRKLNLRFEGAMQGDMSTLRMWGKPSAWGRRYESEVAVLLDDDGQVLSWALWHDLNVKERGELQVYTPVRFRCQGYGTMVLYELRNRHKSAVADGAAYDLLKKRYRRTELTANSYY